MVFESGFTTRRPYATRPVSTSYTVSCPSVQRVSRVFKTSYPIYSTYAIPRRITSGTRVITSPIRVINSVGRSCSRIIRSESPVRVIETTTRVISTPERVSSYICSMPSSYYSPPYGNTAYYSNSFLPVSYEYLTPPSLSKYVSPRLLRSLSPVKKSDRHASLTPYLKRNLPGYGARALSSYLNTEPFTTFQEETNRIRHKAQSLIRDVHTPVVHRSLSSTPFPVCLYEPTSQLALDAYVTRMTNPARHVAREIQRMSYYPEPARKFVGKSHLASVRIVGDKAYNTRRPLYDSEKVRTDINLLSWYMRHPNKSDNKNMKSNTSVKEVEAVESEA